MNEKNYRLSILFLLMMIIMFEVTGIAFSVMRDVQRQELCLKAMNQSGFVGLFTNYEADVYLNPQIDNIDKQTFKEIEYLLKAQMIGDELLVACRP